MRAFSWFSGWSHLWKRRTLPQVVGIVTSAITLARKSVMNSKRFEKRHDRLVLCRLASTADWLTRIFHELRRERPKSDADARQTLILLRSILFICEHTSQLAFNGADAVFFGLVVEISWNFRVCPTPKGKVGIDSLSSATTRSP